MVRLVEDAVAIDVAVAGIAQAVRIQILLALVRNPRTVVAEVAHSVTIAVCLSSIWRIGAVVTRVILPIPIGVGAHLDDMVNIRKRTAAKIKQAVRKSTQTDAVEAESDAGRTGDG